MGKIQMTLRYGRSSIQGKTICGFGLKLELRRFSKDLLTNGFSTSRYNVTLTI
jgi:hypothetical protein